MSPLLLATASRYEPGLFANVMLGVVAIGLIVSIAGALVFLLIMAAQAVVLGQPTLPPKQG